MWHTVHCWRSILRQQPVQVKQLSSTAPSCFWGKYVGLWSQRQYCYCILYLFFWGTSPSSSECAGLLGWTPETFGLCNSLAWMIDLKNKEHEHMSHCRKSKLCRWKFESKHIGTSLLCSTKLSPSAAAIVWSFDITASSSLSSLCDLVEEQISKH